MSRRLTITVALNERHRRIGDSHPKAKLSDREVELVLQLRAQGWTYERLRRKFGVSKSGIAWICRGERRGQAPVIFRTVHVIRRR